MFYCFNLIRVDFNSSVSDQIPYELTSPHSESTFISIEAQLVPLKYFEHLFEIVNMLRLPFSFYHYIVDVHLDYAPNLFSKYSRHHPLIYGPGII